MEKRVSCYSTYIHSLKLFRIEPFTYISVPNNLNSYGAYDAAPPPTVKHTGQRSRGKFYEISKF